jgi:hypothetical protein
MNQSSRTSGMPEEPSWAPPPHGPAIDQANTREALRSYRLRAVALVGGGFAAFVLSMGLVFRLVQDDPGMLFMIPFSVTTGVVLIGLVSLLQSIRMGRMLGRFPWKEWSCRYREVFIAVPMPNGQPIVRLTAIEGRTEALVTLMALNWRWRHIAALNGKTIWVAGDPSRLRRVVVAPPGGRLLFVARRPLLASWWERRLKSTST